MRSTVIAIAMGIVLGPALARADEIMPPPAACAPGTLRMSSHHGPWCEDTTCASDADCAGHEGARVCRRVGVCVPPGTRAIGVQTAESPRGSYPVPGRTTSGACRGPDAPCPDETTCEVALRCVLPSEAAAPEAAGGGGTRPPQTHGPQARGGGCAIARGGSAPDAIVLGAIVLGAIVLGAAARRARGS